MKRLLILAVVAAFAVVGFGSSGHSYEPSVKPAEKTATENRRGRRSHRRGGGGSFWIGGGSYYGGGWGGRRYYGPRRHYYAPPPPPPVVYYPSQPQVIYVNPTPTYTTQGVVVCQ